MDAWQIPFRKKKQRTITIKRAQLEVEELNAKTSYNLAFINSSGDEEDLVACN